jgi:hypothetical protein
VLLYKQLIRPMMDYACPIWRSAARSHVRKLQVLQSKCLHTATNAPWYVSNRQILEDLGIPLFADHVRALIESFDSKLADAGNPLVRQIGRNLCRQRADWSHPRVTEADWCSAGQPKLSIKVSQVGAASSPQLLGYPDWGFPCFSSVIRQMPGYNSKGARPAFPNHGGLQLKWFSPKSQRPSAKAITTLLGSNPREPSNQNPFHKGHVAWWDNLPPVAAAPSLKSQGLPPRQIPR